MSEEKCPICGKPDANFDSPKESLPFCSKRCKNADLGKWLEGHYSVSGPLSDGEVWGIQESTDDD